MSMSADELDALEGLARKIVRELFTNGSGERAGRLVMEPEGGPRLCGLNLGGWSEEGAVGRIFDRLEDGTIPLPKAKSSPAQPRRKRGK